MNLSIYFIGFNIFFLVIALVLFSAQVRKRTSVYALIGSMELIVIITLCSNLYISRLQEIATGERLMAIASTGALQFDPEDLEQLNKAADLKTEAYQRVFEQLNKIRDANPGITYIFILRPTDVADVWEFVADGDSNHDIPFWTDVNNDGILTAEDDENTWPGQKYVAPLEYPINASLMNPIYTLHDKDQWGEFITGLAPIRQNSKVVAVIFVSKLIQTFVSMQQE